MSTSAAVEPKTLRRPIGDLAPPEQPAFAIPSSRGQPNILVSSERLPNSVSNHSALETILKGEKDVVYLDRVELGTPYDLHQALKRLKNIDGILEATPQDGFSPSGGTAQLLTTDTPLIAIEGAEHIQPAVLTELLSFTRTRNLRVLLLGCPEKVQSLLATRAITPTMLEATAAPPIDVKWILQNKPERQLSQYKAGRAAAICTVALSAVLCLSYLL